MQHDLKKGNQSLINQSLIIFYSLMAMLTRNHMNVDITLFEHHTQDKFKTATPFHKPSLHIVELS